MKHLFALALTLVTSSAFAGSPFNGKFCGQGTMTKTEGTVVQVNKGQASLEFYTTDTTVKLHEEKIVFDDGAIVEGTPGMLEVVSGNVLYDGQVVGTVSDQDISVHLVHSQIDETWHFIAGADGTFSYTNVATNMATGVRIEQDLTGLSSCNRK